MLSADGLSDIKHRLAARYIDTEQMLTDVLHLVETVDQLRDLARAVTECSFALVDGDSNQRHQHHIFHQALAALRQSIKP